MQAARRSLTTKVHNTGQDKPHTENMRLKLWSHNAYNRSRNTFVVIANREMDMTCCTYHTWYGSSGLVSYSTQNPLRINDLCLYVTTHDNHRRQTSTPPAGFEPTISTRGRPQAHAFDRSATRTGKKLY